MTELFGLAGQTAVVIGGAGVLGGALCRGLGPGRRPRDRRRSDRRRLPRPASPSCKQCGGKAGYCTVDVTRRESIENLLAAALQQTGRADILVNCAGVNAGSTSSTPPTPTGTAS